MDIGQFRVYIVRDALKAASWWSPAVENIIVATAMVETGLLKFTQDGDGPARGLFQIEGRTYTDLLSYIKKDAEKVKTILSVCGMDSLPDDVDAVIWNLRYAVLITRMFYYRIPQALPKSDDADGMCQYYIVHYNGGGKATVDRDLPIFKQVCSNKEW